MTTYYMTGTLTCSSRTDAASRNTPAVIRDNIVVGLATKPVQPGQVPFRLRDGEKVYNA